MRTSIVDIDAQPFALEICHSSNAGVGDQFEAAAVHAGQHQYRRTGGQRAKIHRRVIPVEIKVAVGEPVRRIRTGAGGDKLDISESLGP